MRMLYQDGRARNQSQGGDKRQISSEEVGQDSPRDRGGEGWEERVRRDGGQRSPAWMEKYH